MLCGGRSCRARSPTRFEGGAAYAEEVAAAERAHVVLYAPHVLDPHLAVAGGDEVHVLALFTLSHDDVLWEEYLHLEQRYNVLH